MAFSTSISAAEVHGRPLTSESATRRTQSAVGCGGCVPTTIVMDALPVMPPVSVALAVMTCVPALKLVLRLAPLPSAPLKLERQLKLEERLPS